MLWMQHPLCDLGINLLLRVHIWLQLTQQQGSIWLLLTLTPHGSWVLSLAYPTMVEGGDKPENLKNNF